MSQLCRCGHAQWTHPTTDYLGFPVRENQACCIVQGCGCSNYAAVDRPFCVCGHPVHDHRNAHIRTPAGGLTPLLHAGPCAEIGCGCRGSIINAESHQAKKSRQPEAVSPFQPLLAVTDRLRYLCDRCDARGTGDGDHVCIPVTIGDADLHNEVVARLGLDRGVDERVSRYELMERAKRHANRRGYVWSLEQHTSMDLYIARFRIGLSDATARCTDFTEYRALLRAWLRIAGDP